MKIRHALSLSITRNRHHDDGEEQFEHRDNDTAIEATYGGDERLHRMGFYTPPSDPDGRVGMQSARVQYHPPIRSGFRPNHEED
ncbi:hypothetical protein J2X60_003002 [Curtobacterium sp. 320]|uniref:hypothetical protein n=1 Tax=Curtobacterium sp. 320 TaxID=2817749 RepID=UPI0028565265|nr:hypothetical protein [Curtobacterium sp. 320]MDR6574343.1 hypothetical protein [Curtobacterium sp. 320]